MAIAGNPTPTPAAGAIRFTVNLDKGFKKTDTLQSGMNDPGFSDLTYDPIP